MAKISPLSTKYRHDSMRGWFAFELYNLMLHDKDIWVITGDLGFKIFDFISRDFPTRFINTGAAEQAMIDIAVGLALGDKKPFVYSITPFLLYRPFEAIRLYIHHERIPVRLVGSGRNKDYKEQGFSHWAKDDRDLMKILKNIKAYWPQNKEMVPNLVKKMVDENIPWYVNLRR